MIEQTEIIMVSGKIPFCVLLEDSIGEDNHFIEEKGIRIASEDDNFVAELYLRKTMRSGVSLASEDLFGELTFSVFSLLFKRANTRGGALASVFKVEDDKFDHAHIVAVATTLVNKFIFIYKSVWGNEKDWLPQVTKFRLSPWTITMLDAKGTKLGGIPVLDYRGTGVMIGNSVNAEQLGKIKHFCLIPDAKTETAAAFCQAANRYKKIGEYPASVIFMATYIEKLIFREIRYRLEKEGKTEGEIREFLTNGSGRYIHRYKAIKKITGNEAFKESSEFLEYEEFIVEPRNLIAHNDPLELDFEFSEKMIQAANNFNKYIVKVIWS